MQYFLKKKLLQNHNSGGVKGMDKGLLIIGAVLIATGVIEFFIGMSMVDKPWSFISTGQVTRLYGIFAVIAGVIITIVGAVKKEKPKKP